VGSIELNFRPLDQTSTSTTGWRIRWKRLVHCTGSETVWSDLVTAKFSELVKKSMRGLVLNNLAQCCLISCPHDCMICRSWQGKP